MMSKDSQTQCLSRKGGILLFGLFLATIGIVFRDALTATLDAWRQDEYSHGYLIPLVGIILLLNKIRNDPLPVATNSWLGLAGMVVCVILEFLFVLAGIGGLQPLLLVGFFLSFFVMTYGIGFSWKMAGPLL